MIKSYKDVELQNHTLLIKKGKYQIKMKTIILKATIYSIALFILTACHNNKDEIYQAYKCSQAALELGKPSDANSALSSSDALYQKLFLNRHELEQKMAEKLGKELNLKNRSNSDRLEELNKIYSTSECQKLYKNSKSSINNNLETKAEISAPEENQINESGKHKLEELFSNFNTCDHPKIGYDISTEEANHPYFKERNIKPYKVEQSLAFYVIDDYLFKMHVSELILPVTWSLTSITFDSPIDEVRPKLNKIFGDGFEAANESEAGYKPKLLQSRDSPSKTVLYCDEPEQN